MSNVNILNKQIELIFSYWNGDVSEEEFDKQKLFNVSEETDREAQLDAC
jgi:hypothetical protein